MKRVPVQRSCVGFKPVSTVVPTTCDVLVDASRWPRADAHTTLPHRAPPQGAIAIMALPMGFFHSPSTGAVARGCATVAAAIARPIDATAFIFPPSASLSRNLGYGQVA